MKTTRGLFTVTMAVCMLLSVTACDKMSDKTGSTSWREPAENKIVTEHFVDSDGEFEYKTNSWDGPNGYVIVYPNGDNNANEYAGILQTYYNDVLKIKLPVVSDSQNESEKEILIGDTNREESVRDSSKSDIEVFLKTSKLVFSAGHSVTLKSAVEKFIRLKPTVNQAFSFSITTDFKATALGNYQYVWGDEFEGSELDFKKWDFEDRMGSTTKIETSWEKDVVNVEDGRLKLHALNSFNPMREGTVYKCPYSVVTKYKMNYTYGYVEIRARVPFYKGSWPSFWGLGIGGQGGTNANAGLTFNQEKSDKKAFGLEVDIFEIFGSPSVVTPDVHKWYRANNYAYDEIHGLSTENHTKLKNKEVWDWTTKEVDVDKISNEYHTYGFEWTEKEMSFYVDGNKYYTLDINNSYDLCPDMSSFHDNIYLMFNNHVFADDQSWYQNLIEDHSLMPFCFYIDYIRVYQQPGVGTITIDDTPREYAGR